MNSRQKIITHLDTEYQRPVRDPLWKHIYLSDAMLELIDTRPCRQLSRIKQLGPSYLVYPGATHTRLNHSLGVYHIAKRMIRDLITAPGMPGLSLEGVKAFLTAALLHDLGHFPYTHSFKELPLKEHETLTGELILSDAVAAKIKDGIGADPYMTAAIVDLELSTGGNEEITFFRHILSGPLDPDKLDYLNRDAYFCGVPYGVQDIDFALSRVLPYGLEGIAIDITGVSAIENILFAKYLMYRAVYWHRTVRVATAMIKKAVYMALRDRIVTPTELYGLDDELFFVKLGDRDYSPFDLVDRVYNRALYRPVVEIPYSEENALHQKISNLDERITMEERIAARIGKKLSSDVRPEEVIVDVPERISFEVSLPVHTADSYVDYPESGTVFTPQVIGDFTHTLRRIRLVLSPRIAERVTDPGEYLYE